MKNDAAVAEKLRAAGSKPKRQQQRQLSARAPKLGARLLSTVFRLAETWGISSLPESDERTGPRTERAAVIAEPGRRPPATTVVLGTQALIVYNLRQRYR